MTGLQSQTDLFQSVADHDIVAEQQSSLLNFRVADFGAAELVGQCGVKISRFLTNLKPCQLNHVGASYRYSPITSHIRNIDGTGTSTEHQTRSHPRDSELADSNELAFHRGCLLGDTLMGTQISESVYLYR